MKRPRRLFIDAQSFQTPNWQRGTGRYSFSLLKAVLTNANHNPFKNQTVIFIISSNLPQSGIWREELMSTFKKAEFKKLDLVTPSQERDCAAALKHNQDKIEEELRKYSPGSEYLCPSLLDDLVYSVIPNLKNVHSYLIFYDLIPLLFRERYLKDRPQYENCYFVRLKQIFRVKTIFTISNTSARDLTLFLNIPPDRIKPILGGAFPLSNPKQPKLAGLKKTDKYILAVLGDDPRKNIIRSCQAYAKFSLENPEYKLILTSNYSQGTKDVVKKIVPEAIFTGSVTDQELSWLYSNTTAVLFTSEYEGLGMPLLESMQAGVPVVCSDIDIMREIAGDSVWYANPYDIDDMVNALLKATNETIDNKKWQEYKKILDKFSWSATAERCNKAVLRSRSNKINAPVYNKQKIAIVGPTPESICSIGRFIQEQAIYLMNNNRVDFYIEDSPSTPAYKKEYLTSLDNCYDIKEFAARSKEYKSIVYHIGNSDFHLLTTRLALSIPGTVVLHDTWLEGLWAEMYRNKIISENRLIIEDQLNKQFTSKSNARYVVSIVKSAKQVVVHSGYANDALILLGIKKDIIKLHHPVPQFHYENEAKQAVNKEPVIGLGGILTIEKGLKLIADLLKDKRFNHVKFSVFGHKTKFDGGLIEQFSQNPRVKLSTDITDLEYIQEMKGVDVLLNYRPQYNGEASRATLEAMRLGVVPIVRDIGWFSELPNAASVKVKSEDQVADALLEIIGNRPKLDRKKKAALEFIQKECQIKDYVNSLVKIIGG